MSDLIVRTQGHAGRITLNRPAALNALTWDMCSAIEIAIDQWRDDPAIGLIVIDAAGDRAFCAGGDIAEMYASGLRGDLDYGRRFWRDEYRLNNKLAGYPKPIVSFLQGFSMGGGVGVGCHASHRIVDDSTRIAMPECGIGLLPDVGGTLLLANAPGYLGTYLGVTGDRMVASDALYAGFADHYVPTDWDALKQRLCDTGDVTAIPTHQPPPSRLCDLQTQIDAAFARPDLASIMAGFPQSPGLAQAARQIARNAPLAMAAAVAVIARVRQNPTMAFALEQEYRFTHRAVAQGDFIEGIRAAIIDKDRTPKWRHNSWQDVTAEDVEAMMAPLGDDALSLKETL